MTIEKNSLTRLEHKYARLGKMSVSCVLHSLTIIEYTKITYKFQKNNQRVHLLTIMTFFPKTTFHIFREFQYTNKNNNNC